MTSLLSADTTIPMTFLDGVRVIVASDDTLGAANAANYLNSVLVIVASDDNAADVCVAGPAP